MRRLLLLAFLVLLGCGGPPPVMPDPTTQAHLEPVWVDSSFSNERRVEIERALADWNFALNGYYQFRIESEKYRPGDPKVLEYVHQIRDGLLIDSVTEEEATAVGEGPTAVAYTEMNRIRVHVVVSRLGPGQNLHQIMLHELGHSLGLGHLPLPDSLMYPNTDKICDCVDGFTLKWLSAIKGYDWHHTRGCPHPL